ncbi:SWI5-dependent HO expression protein 4 [Coemansia asiatica]|uniref:SWI5-dependent HO expression protein 4 n=1 Tax=Coemansia asiatica TaxID=1052880 RepID=A0A9W8CJK2_9FUNG|nr:SWI5-dependent HO expression protein 4 [Coemansia asiatica]
MTTLSDTKTSAGPKVIESGSSRAKLQLDIDSITKKLQSNPSELDPTQLLLQRAQLYADIGNEAGAQADITQAASLVKDPKHALPENIAAVERAFREITISGASHSLYKDSFASKQDEELVDMVVQKTNSKGSFDSSLVGMLNALEARIERKKKALQSSHLCKLVDTFHLIISDEKKIADGKDKTLRALASCISASFAKLSQTRKSTTNIQSPIKDSALSNILSHIIDTWKSHESDGWFKQTACRYGASMYASAVYALVATSEIDPDTELAQVSKALKDAYSFFINQIWLVGTLSTAPAEIKDVIQGALRLLTGHRPLFTFKFTSASQSAKDNAASPFVRLLSMLGQKVDETRSMALLLSSQLINAASEPLNSTLFPGFDAKAARTSSTQKSLPLALVQLRTIATRVLDSWIQSTMQAERARGLLALASLYEAGVGSSISSELWLKDGWVEDLWDQGEFDKPETQLALVRLADACGTDSKVGSLMKKAGNGLVQELVRKGNSSKSTGSSDSVALDLVDSAAVVLAKWSGVSAVSSANPSNLATAAVSAAAASQLDSNVDDLENKTPALEDADPIQLVDLHTKRILELCSKDVSDKNAADSVQRATEALGYLCLKPKIKEYLIQNDSLLRSLLSYTQKTKVPGLVFSATMLIRNLTQYRPVLSEEQKRIQQLQRLSSRAQQPKQPKRQSGKKETVTDVADEDEEANKYDSSEHVSKRSVAVCKAGCLSMLVTSVQPARRPSDNLKDAVAEIMVSLAATQALRGLIVQQGGVRTLLSLLTSDAPKAAKDVYDKADNGNNSAKLPQALRQQRDKNIAFALAKIAISVPPHLAFQDPREIVRLLLSLLAEETETQALLMKFEALLALTNLAGAQPGSAHDVRGYMANDLNGISLIEMVVLSDHALVRRAATELICNLVYEPSVFERFTKNADSCVPPPSAAGSGAHGSELLSERVPSGIVELSNDDDNDEDEDDDGDDKHSNDKKSKQKKGDAYRTQRLHLLVALSDVDDTATRSAAAGALAVLSSDPRCCRYLFLAHPRASDVLLGLLSDDSGADADANDDAQRGATSLTTAFKHRVAVIWANAANSGDFRVIESLRSQPRVLASLREMATDSAMPYYGAAKSALEKIA